MREIKTVEIDLQDLKGIITNMEHIEKYVEELTPTNVIQKSKANFNSLGITQDNKL
jgi:hypothetical protein